MVKKTALEERQDQLERSFEGLALEVRTNNAELREILERLELRLPQRRRRRRAGSSTLENNGEEEDEDHQNTETESSGEASLKSRHRYRGRKLEIPVFEGGFEGPPLYDTYPDEEEDTEPEVATSETEESEKENDGIAGEYYCGDDEPKWDSDDEEPPPKESPEEELDGGATMEEVVPDRDMREGIFSLLTGSCEGEEKTRGSDEKLRDDEHWGRPPEKNAGGATATVEAEGRTREVGASFFSFAANTCDREREGKKVAAAWKLGVMDFNFNLLGQAQTFIHTPSQITKNGEELQEVKKMDKVKKTKVVWKLKGVDLTFNLLGQAQTVFNTSTQFTNNEGVFQVERGVNHRMCLFLMNLEHLGINLLDSGVINVVGVCRRCCRGLVQLKDISNIVELLIVHQWNPSGLKEDGWNPSGLNLNKSMQESATCALEYHGSKTDQHHQVFVEILEIEIDLLDRRGFIPTASTIIVGGLAEKYFKTHFVKNHKYPDLSIIVEVGGDYGFGSACNTKFDFDVLNAVIKLAQTLNINFAQNLVYKAAQSFVGKLLQEESKTHVSQIVLHVKPEEDDGIVILDVIICVIYTQSKPGDHDSPFVGHISRVARLLKLLVEGGGIEESDSTGACQGNSTLQHQQAMHVAPLYIAETAPSSVSGLLIFLEECFIVIGIVARYGLGSSLVDTAAGFTADKGIVIVSKCQRRRGSVLGRRRNFDFAIMSDVHIEDFRPLGWASLTFIALKIEHCHWEPGGIYYSPSMCLVRSLHFQLWDPGGRPSSLLLSRYLHLEDKVNFEGGSIDENLSLDTPGQTNRFGRVYFSKGKRVIGTESSGGNGVTN